MPVSKEESEQKKQIFMGGTLFFREND